MSDKYVIRKATFEDEQDLRRFIDEHWRKDHVFVKSKTLLDWQHRDEATQSYSFILGIEKETGDIHGVLGFITLAQFDPQIDPERIIWMAIWKVRDAARGHRLGRNIQSFLVESEKPDIISTVAASAMTLSMYEALGYQVDKLKQYFVLNAAKREYNLAHIPNDFSAESVKENIKTSLIPISREDVLLSTQHCFDSQGTVPLKTPAYIVGRYYDHPIYDYECYKILQSSEIIGLIVTRNCHHDGTTAIRIVDFIGKESALNGLGSSWQDLMMKSGAEYLDFYNAGISDSVLRSSGFLDADDYEGLIIPNYFEPFLQKKISIDFMISSPKGTPYRIVKGDSDQDRPNSLPAT
ncbi:hypothetical protein N9M10_01485 [Hellea sp.]|nr:hypothetical protein [Hellea sp.]